MPSNLAALSHRRTILVSNRLPVTIRKEGGKVEVAPSAGGLATGLRGLHERGESLWIGWPGETHELDDVEGAELRTELQQMKTLPVDIPPDEFSGYYEGFSNGIIWPSFHYLIDRLPSMTRDWEAYRKVNERFADEIAKHATEDDQIWIHDYHLLLLPRMLRERLPRARIGFFLHIPFPSSEVFRILPWSADLLRGMLGADLIGFHTFAYARHFTTSLLRTLGVEPEIDNVSYGGRRIQIGVFPMSIDGEYFTKLAGADSVVKEVQALREANGDKKLIFGVDRLDYTKGLLRRMLGDRVSPRTPARAAGQIQVRAARRSLARECRRIR